MSGHKVTRGHCLCKAITYEITTDASYESTVALCHCTHCQVSGGSVASYNAFIPSGSFKVTSETQLTEYVDSDTASGNPLTRCFCPKCGSPIVSLRKYGGIAVVKVPSFSQAGDNSSGPVPQLEIFNRSKNAWESKSIFEDAKQFETSAQTTS